MKCSANEYFYLDDEMGRQGECVDSREQKNAHTRNN